VSAAAVTPIRIGIVGAGGIARAEHLPRFRRIEGVELVGVANRTAASSERVAAEEGLARAYPRWEELVADDGIDAVLVATWPDLHAPVTVAALDAGKHVLTEARMSATLEDADAMLAASKAHPDRVAMVVPSSFSLWADRTIRRQIDGRAIGRVRHVRVLWDASGSVAPSEDWRWQRRSSGVNVMGLGILYEAMARWLGRATAVHAIGSIVQPEKPGRDGPVRTDVFDHLLVGAVFPDEVTASMEMSIVSVQGGTRIAIVGEDASIEFDLAGESLTRVSPAGDRTPIDVLPKDRLEWSAEIDFVRSIRTGEPVELTDFETGVAYMAFVDAVDRSAHSGARIELPA
jgi:predicted dehydrogenase